MQLVYSALSPENEARRLFDDIPHDELIIRFNAYRETCDKYSQEIAQIRKYFPGWAPKFR